MLIAAVVASDGILAESAEEAVQGDGTRGGSGSDSRFLLIGFIAVSSSFSSLMFSKYFCSRPTNFKSCLCIVGDETGNSADLVGSLSVFCTPIFLAMLAMALGSTRTVSLRWMA